MDGSCFVILKDGPDCYIRVTDVIDILSAQYSPKDRDQIAEFLNGILAEPSMPPARMN
jgi:hypothetical protein